MDFKHFKCTVLTYSTVTVVTTQLLICIFLVFIYTHTYTKTTCTMAGCEYEACSPALSFNINGLPDNSRKGREKTRQIAGRGWEGGGFCVEKK